MSEETSETVARFLYDTYFESVGGKAWDGRPLPSSSEFFTDASKKKQADAWREVAKHAKSIFER